MGEYITTNNGNKIKLGTCEHLMYVRKDEVESEALVNSAIREYLDPKCSWIYRFPWPQEDGQMIACAGEREPFDYGHFVFACDDLEVEHQEIAKHVSAGHSYGLNVMIPCPAGKDFNLKRSLGDTFHPFRIIGERVKPGQYYTVFACGYCDQWFSLEEEEGIEKIRQAILACEPREERDKPDTWYKKVVARLRAR
jgi:hypothetical protein